MNYHFSPDARTDLLAAAEFYEMQRLGLGAEFIVDVDHALEHVVKAPGRWPELQKGIRRFRLTRFPYALIYRTLPALQTVEIIAVFDLRRRPGSWRRHRAG